MPVTVRGTDILFNDNTTQSTAAGATPSTNLDGIGSYAVLINATESDLAQGGTRAGSLLRANFSTNSGILLTNQCFIGVREAYNAGYNGGGSSLSGTWRKMSNGQIYAQTTDEYGTVIRRYGQALYVRIS
jgi:hypothetical protein